jgi:hypothetical protein
MSRFQALAIGSPDALSVGEANLQCTVEVESVMVACQHEGLLSLIDV